MWFPGDVSSVRRCVMPSTVRSHRGKKVEIMKKNIFLVRCAFGLAEPVVQQPSRVGAMNDQSGRTRVRGDARAD